MASKNNHQNNHQDIKYSVLEAAREEAIELAIRAGEKLLKYRKRLGSLTITSKEAQGVASVADIESEKLIVRGLQKRFPEMNILAEESAYEQWGGKKEAYAHFKELPYVWAIDPLDGTSNFLAGMDYFAVCIGLLHYGVPYMGVVYRPTTGECWTAIKGRGAKYNEDLKSQRFKKLWREKNTKSLKSSLLVTGFSSEKGDVFDREFHLFKSIMGEVRGVRRMGSAALDLCFVASGVFDGFWESGLAPWDVAAAGVIATESGVKITDYQGRAFHPFQDDFLAGRNPFYQKMKTSLHSIVTD